MGTGEDRGDAVTPPLLGVTGDIRYRSENRGNAGGTGRVRQERCRLVLRLLAGFRALRHDQVENLLLHDDHLRAESRRVATHRVITDLRRRRLIEAVMIAGPADRGERGYVLTADGRRVYAAADPAYPLRRARTPSTVYLEHATMLADIAIALRDAARVAGIALSWESDWEAVTRIGCATAIPDALASFAHGGWRTRAFIEADRSTEHDRAFALKVRRYVQLYLADEWRTAMSSWPLILTVTTSDARARALARVCARVAPAEGGSRIARAFRTTSLDALRNQSAFEEIWYLGGSAARIGILERDAAGDAVLRARTQ